MIDAHIRVSNKSWEEWDLLFLWTYSR